MADLVRQSPSELLRQNKAAARRITERKGGKRILKALQRAELDLVKRLRTHGELRTLEEAPFTRAKLEVALLQVRDVLNDLRPKMKESIVTTGNQAGELAVRGVVKFLNAKERQFRGITRRLPIREVALLDRATVGIESSILRRIEVDPQDPRQPGVLNRYSTETIRVFEETLQNKLLTGASWNETREDLIEKSEFLKGAPRHWADRIIRTEVAAAYNRGGWESNKIANEMLGDVVKIVVATFDSRTGADSYNVHGQIRRPDEPFEYINYKGETELFQAPPNRPNDREVVVTWRLSWGEPPESMQPLDDSEVESAYAEQKLTFHGRPNMSTLPEDAFEVAKAESLEEAEEELS